jgi:hypothetical protein
MHTPSGKDFDMHNPFLRFLGMLALALLSGGSVARADPMYSDWSYHWSITPGPVLTSGTGSVALALAQNGTGASSIPAATVTTTSSATTNPDRYNVGYTLTLHLTDNGAQPGTVQTDTLNFHGTIAGTVTASSSNLTNTFSDPTQSLTLDGHKYSVTINPTLMTLPAPGSPTLPQITALVSVTNASPVPPSGAPEPSSVLLGSMGILLGGSVAVWRSRHLALARIAA